MISLIKCTSNYKNAHLLLKLIPCKIFTYKKEVKWSYIIEKLTWQKINILMNSLIVLKLKAEMSVKTKRNLCLKSATTNLFTIKNQKITFWNKSKLKIRDYSNQNLIQKVFNKLKSLFMTVYKKQFNLNKR